MNRYLSILLTLVIAGFITPGAFAQSDTLECGARIVSNQPLSNGSGDRICLFVDGTGDRARVVLRGCSVKTADLRFLWRIIRHDGGGLYIRPAAAERADRRMEVADFNKSDGAAIQIWGANAGNGYRSQTWDLFPVTNPFTGVNGFMIISVDSGKCLNVPLGRSPLDQEVAQLFTCARALNDTWRIEPVLEGSERDCM